MPRSGFLQLDVLREKKLALLILVPALLASSLAAAPSTAPRMPPEFTISEPSGKSILLSSRHGKVVAIEFFFLQSNHCTQRC